MEKITTESNGAAAKELYFSGIALTVFSIVFAFICAGIYVGFSLWNNNWFNPINFVVLIMGVIILFFAIMMLINITRAISKTEKLKHTLVEDFQDEQVVIEAYRNGEKIQELSFAYDDIKGMLESKNYVFLKTKNSMNIPVVKSTEIIQFLEGKGVRRDKLGFTKRK